MRASCYNGFLHLANYGLTAGSYAASGMMHLTKAINIASAKTTNVVESIGKYGLPVAGVVLAVDNLEVCGITERCIKIISPGFKDGVQNLNPEYGMHCLVLLVAGYAALKLTESVSDSLYGCSKSVMQECETRKQENLHEIKNWQKKAEARAREIEVEARAKAHYEDLQASKTTG